MDELFCLKSRKDIDELSTQISQLTEQVDAGGAVYELIEKIIVGYSIQTAQPEDWETNWADYSTNTGTAMSPVYTAVGGETAPTWEENKYYTYSGTGVSSVVRETYPNGEAMALSGLSLKFEIPAGDAMAGSAKVYFNSTDHILVYGNAMRSTTNQTYSVFEYFVKNGFWDARIIGIRSVTGSANPLSSGSYPAARYSDYFAHPVSEKPSIVKIDFTPASSAVVPSGTIIELWGAKRLE